MDWARIQAFLDPLPISRIWGVGKASEVQLADMGTRTIRQVREASAQEFRNRFGEWGDHIWELAHGRDDRPVVSEGEAKSLSHETTFAQDLDNLQTLRAVLLEITGQVARRLRQAHLRARIVEVKIRSATLTTRRQKRHMIYRRRLRIV